MIVTRRDALASIGATALAGLASKTAYAVPARLIAAAREEGQVVWYTTLIVNQVVRPLVNAFQKTYPGIKVNFVPVPPVETATRILNEAKARSVKADVFSGAPTFYPLRAANLVGSYQVENTLHWPAEYRDPAGYWSASNLFVVSPAINTDLVNPNDAPRTLQDLLHPRWTGRMAWSDTEDVAGPPGVVGNILLGLGQEAGMDYLRRLARQKIVNIPAVQRVVLDQCIAGEYPLVLSIFNHHADISARQGAPVKWLAMEPMLVMTFGMHSILAAAPHPNAARLFVEFLAGEAGQTVLRDASYLPANPRVAPLAPELLPAGGGFKARVISPDLFAQNKANWVKVAQDLFH